MKTKVAIIITKMELGGAQQVALETAKRLDPERFEVWLLSGEGGLMADEAAQALGDHFVSRSFFKHEISPLRDLAATLWMAWFFLKHRIQVVHTHSSKAGVLGRAAAWVAGVPIVVHTVHGWSFHDFMGRLSRRFYVLLERILAAVTTRLLVVAESLEAKGLASGIGEHGQYQLIRAAIDVPVWRSVRANRAAKLRELGLPPGTLLVGTLANCKAQKNPLDFVAVAARVVKGHPQAAFLYIGDGPQREGAETEVRRLGLEKKVRFLGWRRQDSKEITACLDVFLLTSLWEGLPCVFPQAFLLGLPIVATAVDGAQEVVKEGVNGFLCQPKDVEAMADRVSWLLARPAVRRTLGLAGRKSVGKEWDFGDMARRTAALYEECGREDPVPQPHPA
jgi:glycosyltransferase involved in cell wall biosynthesis